MTVHDGAAAPADAPREVDGRAMFVSFALTAVFDVAVAIAGFQLATSAGASPQVAYLVAGVGPLVMLGINRMRSGQFGGISVVILGYLVISAAVALLLPGDDARLLLVKDSLVTGGFGLACLVSLALPKPLMFFFGVRFATDGSREGVAYWYGLWRYPDFRRSQYVINNLWGVTFLVEALVRIVVVETTADFGVANTVCTVLPFLVLAGLITATIVIGRRTRAAAMTRIGAATSGAAPSASTAGEPDGGA